MTDLPHHRDDEIVSAVLDGEATADERARVDTEPELQRRLAEMRHVRDAVAAPVEPLDELSARRLVDGALSSASSEGAAAAPAGSRSGRSSRRRPREGSLIGLGSAAALILLALLVGPGLLSLGDDDSADFATVAGDLDDSGPEAESDGEALQLERYDAADAWEDDAAGPPDEAAEGAPPPYGLSGDDREWLGTYESVEELLAELEMVVGRRLEALTPTSGSSYGFASPECPEPVDDDVWSEALVGPFTTFDAVVDGRHLLVIVGTDDDGAPVVAIVDLATCEPVDPS